VTHFKGASTVTDEQTVVEEQAPAEGTSEAEQSKESDFGGYYIPEHLPRQFVSDRDGRPVVSFQGLIHLLHDITEGEFSVVNEVIQQGSKDNGNETIVRCTIEGQRRGKTGSSKVPFTVVCYGDAAPGNITRMIEPHMRRMAETRAMARAMRVATNVGLVAAEELGPGRATPPAQGRPAGNNVPARVQRTAVEQYKADQDGAPKGDEAGIIFRGAKRNRTEMVQAMRARVGALNKAGLTDYTRVGEDEPLGKIAGFIDAMDKRLKEHKEKNETTPPAA
jgi:hypothetical protein